MKDARAVAAVCCMIPGGEEAEMEAEMEGDNISKISEQSGPGSAGADIACPCVPTQQQLRCRWFHENTLVPGCLVPGVSSKQSRLLPDKGSGECTGSGGAGGGDHV